MSTGGSFWDGGAWAPGFGVYSTSTKNQNKRNVGYNNSLNEGGNYSTTLGVNFSTVAGGNFSTTGVMSMSTVVGANMPNTEGGKVELIIPWSVKWTRGLYDYDFKSCTTQTKVGSGDIYNYNTAKTTNFTLTNDEWVKKTDKTFAQQADEWVGTKNLVAQSDIQKIVDGNLSYVSLTQNVVKEVSQTIGGSNSATASIHNLNSIQGGQLQVGALVRINAPTVKITGALVNIG